MGGRERGERGREEEGGEGRERGERVREGARQESECKRLPTTKRERERERRGLLS